MGKVHGVVCQAIGNPLKLEDNESLQGFKRKTGDKDLLLSPSFSHLGPYQPQLKDDRMIHVRTNDQSSMQLGEFF